MNLETEREIKYSLIIPVYKNEENIPDLLAALEGLNESLGNGFEVVFVVDGSPDRSHLLLETKLSTCLFYSRLSLLSKNFGSFAAIRAGLTQAQGKYFAVMAADLQEPPLLILEFFKALESEEVDIVLGVRRKRADPFLSRVSSGIFWGIYRRYVQPEMPAGGIDVFGCNRHFREQLLRLHESHSTLVGLILWMGFRRREIGYDRLERRLGKSAWTFSKKLRYLTDSIFSFSDLPIRLLVSIGILGMLFSVVFSLLVLIAKLNALIPIPGYAATVLTITFFAGLNCLGLGVIGSYIWRAFENSKGRPQSIIMLSKEFGPK